MASGDRRHGEGRTIVASRSGGRSRRRVALGVELGLGLLDLDLELGLAEGHARARRHDDHGRQPRAVDEGAVGRPEVLELDAVLVGADGEVAARDLLVVDRESAFSRPTTSSPTSSMRSPARGPDRTIRKGMRATLTGTPARAHCN